MGRRGGEGTEFTVKYAGTALDKVGFTFFPFWGGAVSQFFFLAKGKVIVCNGAYTYLRRAGEVAVGQRTHLYWPHICTGRRRPAHTFVLASVHWGCFMSVST